MPFLNPETDHGLKSSSGRMSRFLRHEVGYETGRREHKLTGPYPPQFHGSVFPFGLRDEVSGQHQEGLP